MKEKRERTQINKIRNEKGEIKTDTKEIQRIVKKSTRTKRSAEVPELGK